jgi:hypothetical protein
MTDSLTVATALFERLEQHPEWLLPEADPVIAAPTAPQDRVELRQIAGISAGGSMELTPGHWDFGPSDDEADRLQDGAPAWIGFSLHVDDHLSVIVEPGNQPVRVNGEAVRRPTVVDDAVIDAGTARFVVARPQGGPTPSLPAVSDDEDAWVVDPVPRPATMGTRLNELVARRRQLHPGPHGIRRRIEEGRTQFGARHSAHPLFGTAVVGMADIRVRSYGLDVAAPSPVALDLVANSTVITGRRPHQLAVVRHLVLSLAATCHPEDLRIGLHSVLPDLAFVRDLPHAADHGGPALGRRGRTLLVVDRARPEPVGRGRSAAQRWPILPAGGTMLVLGRPHEPVPDGARIVSIHDEATLSIEPTTAGPGITDVTPVGYAETLALELADQLSGRSDQDFLPVL